MVFNPYRKISIAFIPVFFSVIFLFLMVDRYAALAQSNAPAVRQVRVLETDETGISNPAGLIFSPRANAFYVMEGQKRGQADTDLIKLTPFADRAGSARITAAIKDPRNMAFDQSRGRLLIFQSPSNRLIEVLETADGDLDPRTLNRQDARHFGLQNPQGMAVDPSSGHLFFLDASGPRLVRIAPEPDGTVDEAQVSVVDLQAAGLDDVRGLALDPTTSHLHLLAGQKLYEFSQSGAVMAERDLAEFGFRDPQGMVFAPSGDLTDDPAEISLYITEQGAANAPTTGKIAELSFSAVAEPAAATAEGTLIRTIDTSLFSPPSPDPSGLAYLPHSGTLLISDGEVNEMPQYFTGDNLFEISLTGSLLDTLTSLSFSDEPAGLEVNPVNRHLFVSDDTGQRRVYELNPGPDGLYNTPDDLVSSFLTSAFGSMDPEGLAYDPGTGTLFVLDGVNRELYRITPGPNGIFDGIPPEGDDQVAQSDTLSLGLDDPEGLAFNPLNGNLYAVGKPRTLLFELTTAGALVRTIDISAADARKPAGLAFGPGSVNPAEMSIYIAARGVDNDSDPDENDGKVYEIALGISADIPTNTPTSTATSGPTNTPTATPTLTSTPTSGPSATPSFTATFTNTPLPSSTLTNTPTATNTPVVSSLSLPAAADARVLQSNPTTNYGTTIRLDVDNPGEESYLRFTVSGVTGAVQNATLRLWVTNGSSNGPSLYQTSNSWTETGITWNNRPAPTSGALASAGAITAGTWVEFDVTSLITGNGSYDFVLLPNSTDGATFTSREGAAGAQPQLVLTFTTGPAPTATNTPTVTNTPTSGPSPTPSFTPTFTSTPLPSSTPTNTPVVSSLSLPAAADARVRQTNPNTNYGTTIRLDVDNPGEESYLRFTVSGVSGTVQNATLRLWVTNGSSNGPSLYQTSSSWTETGITWNNRPAPTSGALASAGAITAGTWAEFDVTSLITGNGSYDFVLLPNSTDGATFTSREGAAGAQPQLVLTFP